MNRFLLPLRVELLNDRKTWRLLADFSYEDSEFGSIRVPEGFETDFASVPRIPVVFDLVGAYGHAAAVLHDYLYGTALLPREQADEVFFNALRSSGISRWRAWVMWAGPRFFGSSRYSG